MKKKDSTTITKNHRKVPLIEIPREDQNSGYMTSRNDRVPNNIFAGKNKPTTSRKKRMEFGAANLNSGYYSSTNNYTARK